jgi:hypothetical protein
MILLLFKAPNANTHIIKALSITFRLGGHVHCRVIRVAAAKRNPKVFIRLKQAGRQERLQLQ